MKIGVFDSGIGGLSVANAIQEALPEDEVILREDREHIPYGSKQPAEIKSFVVPILQQMVAEGCQVIVIACNTVTTTVISDLRQQFKVPLVAIEPMVKPAAALTKTGVIAVCATPTTLKSPRYAQLKQEFAKDITIIEPDCSDWTAMIEAKQIEKLKLDQHINQALQAGADVIVLACTHYHWIEDEIKHLAAGKAQVIQPEQPLIEQLKRVLEQLS